MIPSDLMTITEVHAPQSRWEVWTRQPQTVVGYTLIVKDPMNPAEMHIACETEADAQALIDGVMERLA
jgi:hypothetical protein